MKQKKVAIVSPLDYTGISYYSHSLCQSLSGCGVNVALFTTRDRVAKPGAVAYDIFEVFSGTYGSVSKIKKGLRYILCILNLFRQIIAKKFEIVHCQILDFPPADFVFFLLLKLTGRKIVYTPHDIFSLKGREVGNICSRFLYALSDAIVAHNQANKEMLCGIRGDFREKIHVIPHGNYNYFMHRISKVEARKNIELPIEKKILLIFGNLREGKGIEVSLRALGLLKEKDNLILLAGKVSRGFDIDVLKQDVQRLGLQSRVIFRCAFIPDDLVESYYKAADVCLVPYQKGYESGVLRFAFSSGVPVIASDLKEFSEILKDGENCLVCRAGEVGSLSEKMAMILNDEKLAVRLANAAKRMSDIDWDWMKIAGVTDAAYKTL